MPAKAPAVLEALRAATDDASLRSALLEATPLIGHADEYPEQYPPELVDTLHLEARSARERLRQLRRANVPPPAGSGASTAAPRPPPPVPAEPPDAFVCPIRLELMRHPVFCMDGHSYERDAIEAWFTIHDTSPMTQLPLQDHRLTPNYALRSQIADWKEKRGPSRG